MKLRSIKPSLMVERHTCTPSRAPRWRSEGRLFASIEEPLWSATELNNLPSGFIRTGSSPRLGFPP